MAQATTVKEMQLLGITERGRNIPGTCPLLYPQNMFWANAHSPMIDKAF